MSVPSACPHCQLSLPDGFIGRACPHCRGALGGKRKRSLSGFSFQASTGAGASSLPPLSPHSSAPPREVVEDRWDLPDPGDDPPRERGAVPPSPPTGFPAVPSPATARSLRSTMALGVVSPEPAAQPPAAQPPAARAQAADGLRSTALLNPFGWDLDRPASPAAPARSPSAEVRALKQTALGVSPAAPPAPGPAPTSDPPSRPYAALRKTALGVAPQPVAPAAAPPAADTEDFPEADAFPLVRISHPPAVASTRPPPAFDATEVHAEIDIPSAPAPGFELDHAFAHLDEPAQGPSQLPAYAPLRAPPPGGAAVPAGVGWWWPVGGGALALAAGVALRSAPLAVALRAAAAAASLLMLARLGGLSMRALLLLLVALPALAQEALSISPLSRAGAAVFTGALVLLPAGAWLSADRLVARRALVVAGMALTLAAAFMPGGVPAPWSFAAAPVVALGVAALLTPARWAAALVTAALMAWAAACGASDGGGALAAAATGLAAATLVLLCGRALAAVLEGDD